MATRFHPPSPDDLHLTCRVSQTVPGVSQPAFSQPEESTKAVPEGSGKSIHQTFSNMPPQGINKRLQLTANE
jgi:hypothetical protein